MIKIDRSFIEFPRFFVLSFILVSILPACKNYHKNSTNTHVSDSSIEDGKSLAKRYCQSCHMLPEPSLMDKKSWKKGALPEMGPRLGIFSFGYILYPRVTDGSVRADFYPRRSLLTSREWQSIIDYFVANSPDSLPPQARKDSIRTGLPLFEVQIPNLNYENPATCYVKINSRDALHPLIISDAIKQKIYFISHKLTITDSVPDTGPVVDIDFTKNNLLACNIGVVGPNNGRFGKGVFININSKGQSQKNTTTILDSLQRPVQITPIDLNNDGKQDYLVCEFGYLTGALSWMENLGNNNFKKHIIRNFPGAIKAYIQDYNHDGRPDIWALFAQGEEGIFLFTNKGDGNFSQEEVLRFPPSYGSSYFELADFNKDGYPDIVYTCGDNGDYSPILKPYHGVYIFMNDKTNHFTQKFFFPINGCYKAIARDYDGDGDLDIATISFFADYAHQPEESFVYLKNAGNFEFQPYSFPEADIGRWLTMDAGDIDGDGKTDIILGNFSIVPAMMHKVDWMHSPPFIILRNIGK
jgi:FG-GAP-like repeat